MECGCGRSNHHDCSNVSQQLFTDQSAPHNVIVGPLLRSCISPTYMNDGPALRVFLSLTQYFMSDWGRITFAECYVLQEVRQRVTLAPAKIDVREFPRLVTQEQ